MGLLEHGRIGVVTAVRNRLDEHKETEEAPDPVQKQSFPRDATAADLHDRRMAPTTCSGIRDKALVPLGKLRSPTVRGRPMGSLTGAMTVLPGWLGLDREGFEVGIWEVARTLLTSNRLPRESGDQ